MRLTLGVVLILLLYPLLLITSLIARTMAVVSAISANVVVMIIFWTKSEKLVAYALKKLDLKNEKETT